MKLYSFRLSGHSHRVRLFLSLLGVDYEEIEVNLREGAHKQPDFLKLNAFGQVPVLDDDGIIVPDANAILVYLSKKFGRADWLPEDPAGAASVQRWLSVAAGQLASGPGEARLITVFNAPFRPEEVIPRAHAILSLIDQQLAGTHYLCGASATIADIALYSYVARAPEGDVALTDYAHIGRWLAAIEAMPRFVEFPAAIQAREVDHV